ncbi:MAG: hypothetical protein PHQ36_07275 [Anaerolineales bacterium]|nr:hypothetical protein [Anaerolineales bacterium]
MKKTLILKSDDPIIKSLNFKPYRSVARRRVVPFAPANNDPQTMEVITPWKSKLTVTRGDLLISELDKPEDVWPIDAQIFDQTYIIVAPGVCIKRAITWLVPLEDVAQGDKDQIITVHTLEGTETVRAGDFFLAKGIQGEIWPYPKEKAALTMKPAE